MDPSMIMQFLGPLLGGVGSALFQGSPPTPQLTPEQQRAFRMMMGESSRLMNFANSVPLSSAAEQQGLAQQRGLAGQQFGNDQNQLFAAMSQANQGNTGDMLAHLKENQSGQLMGMNSNAFLSALLNRQQAGVQAADVARGAGGLASQTYTPPPGPNLASLFGSLAHALSYNNARQQNPMTPPSAAPQGITPQIAAGFGAGMGLPAASEPGFYNSFNPPGRQIP